MSFPSILPPPAATISAKKLSGSSRVIFLIAPFPAVVSIGASASTGLGGLPGTALTPEAYVRYRTDTWRLRD